jgi:hypothetical protein
VWTGFTESGFCEHGNESLRSTECEVHIYFINEYPLLKKVIYGSILLSDTACKFFNIFTLGPIYTNNNELVGSKSKVSHLYSGRARFWFSAATPLSEIRSFVFFHRPHEQTSVWYLRLCHHRILPNPFYFLIHCPSYNSLLNSLNYWQLR